MAMMSDRLITRPAVKLGAASTDIEDLPWNRQGYMDLLGCQCAPAAAFVKAF
jgi:hypothetical protein